MTPARAPVVSSAPFAKTVSWPSLVRTPFSRLLPESLNSFKTLVSHRAGLIPIPGPRLATSSAIVAPSRCPVRLGFFTTNLFSAKAKLAVLREPFVPARRDGQEESIAEFVIRRLGQEFLDHAIDALVAGVYAGDPYKLSVPHAFPKLGQLEAKYGSLIKGQILGARERKKRGEIAKDRAPKFSFDEGLQVLTDTLAAKLGESLQLQTPVTRLRRSGATWQVTVRSRNGAADSETTIEHDYVIYAGTAFDLAKLPVEAPPGPLNLSPLSGIRHPPVASVVLGFKREEVEHPCQGFGMLIPKVEGFKILGTIFSSALFPNRAPAGHVTLTSYVGGERYPELASLPADQLVALTLNDLRVLLGVNVKANPVFTHVAFYPKAIPQYNVGFGKYRELMTKIETDAPGLFLAGHYRDGVSLSDSIVSGCNIADRVAAIVESQPASTAQSRTATRQLHAVTH